jgi:hypothetical protein
MAKTIPALFGTESSISVHKNPSNVPYPESREPNFNITSLKINSLIYILQNIFLIPPLNYSIYTCTLRYMKQPMRNKRHLLDSEGF